jgi:hypothetical protein
MNILVLTLYELCTKRKLGEIMGELPLIELP